MPQPSVVIAVDVVVDVIVLVVVAVDVEVDVAVAIKSLGYNLPKKMFGEIGYLKKILGAN